ncbi:uncharacterized protein LJ264_004812 isoform 2-T2 [Porphyrio hochstetteri]
MATLAFYWRAGGLNARAGCGRARGAGPRSERGGARGGRQAALWERECGGSRAAPRPSEPPRRPPGALPHPRNGPFTGVLASSCKSKKKKKEKKWIEKTMRVEPGWKAPSGAGSGGAGSRRLRPRRSLQPLRLRAPTPRAGAAAGAGGPASGARRQTVLSLRASGGSPREPSKIQPLEMQLPNLPYPWSHVPESSLSKDYVGREEMMDSWRCSQVAGDKKL